LELREEKQTFVKVGRGKIDFYLSLSHPQWWFPGGEAGMALASFLSIRWSLVIHKHKYFD